MAIINGTPGANNLTGTSIDDLMSGFAGNDTLLGGNGNDTMYGGIDNDSLVGGNGNDWMYGEEGNDSLEGGSGNDSASGGAGNDVLGGGSGNDTMSGGADNDTLQGGSDNDLLAGDAGNDSVAGEGDNDTLVGGLGNDTLRGDGGNDQFNILKEAGSITTILDFKAGVGGEKIDLSAFGIQDFSEVASHASGKDTVLDLANDQDVVLKNVKFGTLVSDNFIYGEGLAKFHFAAGSDIGITYYGNFTDPVTTNEPYNLSQTVTSFGYDASFTNASTAADMTAFLADKEALILSEDESWFWGNGGIPSAISSAVKDFVANGGTLVVMGSDTDTGVTFLNDTFAFGLTLGGDVNYVSEKIASAAAGTVFADNAANLGDLNRIEHGINTSSLPAGALNIYEGIGGDAASVAVMGYGHGQVAYVAFDWYDAAPAGSQDSGWVEVLKDSLSYA